jgi:hypothetical protein
MNQWLFGAMLSGMAIPAFAATPDEGWCRNGGFTTENPSFGLAVVNRKVRAHVLADMNGCPNDERRCRAGYHLNPGKRVVTGRSNGKYVCAYFPNADGGGSAGWLDWSSLRRLHVDVVPTASSWVGRWSDGGNPTLRIAGRRGVLAITGEAFWPGPEPFEGGTSPHSGNIRGKLFRTGNRAHYNVDGCKIEFTLLGDTLVVGDNERCGGTNVRFDGVYRHQAR